MKKVILFCLIFLCLISTSFSQVRVNNLNLNDLPKVHYLELNIVPEKGMCKARIHYGQESTIDQIWTYTLHDEKQETRLFENRVAVFNFLYENNWEFVNSLGEGEGKFATYLFQKRAN